jgi:large repetitive protein
MRTPLVLLASLLSVAPPTPPATTPPGPAAARPAAKPAPPPLPVLQGVVKGPDGKPVEKALVSVRGLVARMGDVPLSARTDATGAFRVTLPRPGLVNVRVEAKGLAAKALDRVPPTAPLTVTLLKGLVLEGVVKDGGTGQPVPGAKVEARLGGIGMFPPAWEPDAGVIAGTADAKGAFRLEGLGTQAYTVSAAARGYGRAQRSSILAGRRVELFLFPGASLRGVVRAPAGEPIADAVVRVEGNLRPFQGPAARPTDAAGRYEMLGVDPGIYRVFVHHKDWAMGVAGNVTIDRQADVELDFRLEKGVKVTGRLVDGADRAVSGRVAVQEVAGETGTWTVGQVLRADAGADGRFSIDRLPSGEHALGVDARGFAPKRVEVSTGDRPVDLGDVVLEPGGTIRGRVRERSGLAIGQAQVSAFAPNRGALRLETVSEPDGSFVLAGLQGGAFRLTARATGYGSTTVSASTGAENVDVVLEPAGMITGIAMDDGGRPVEAFQATANPTRREPGMMMMRAGSADMTTAADGRFTLYDLASGEYVVEVSAPEKGRGVVSGVKVAPGATTDVGRVTLKGGGIVRGQVVDGAGGPVPGATVSVSGGERFFMGPDRPTAMSDGAGAFEVRGVPPGTVTASATHPSFAAGQVAGLDVDVARPAEARIVLTQGGRIEGVARRRGNAPVAGATIQVFPDRRTGMMMLPEMNQAVTAADGTFSLEHVTPGRARVMLMAREGSGTFTSSQSREVEVQEGQTASVEFLSREILLSGRVTRGGGGYPGVRLSLRSDRGMMMVFGGVAAEAPPAGPQRMIAVTREDGSYEMLVDEPGEFRMWFESMDGRSLPGRGIQVPDTESFAQDFEFSGIVLSGVVIDKDTEQPLANANVSASMVRGGRESSTQATGPDGRFQLEVDAGDYHVYARVDGYGSVNQEVTIGPSGVSDLRLAMARGLALRGKVVDARGRPAANLQVSASPVDSERGGFGFGTSLADGSFTVDGLEQRPYVLLAGSWTGAGYGLLGPVNPGDRDLVVRLRPPGRVRVTVLGPDGAPVKGVHPRVVRAEGYRIGGPMAGDAETDESGVAEMTVIAGNLEIEAGRRQDVGKGTVSVPEGGSAALEIRLEERRSTSR